MSCLLVYSSYRHSFSKTIKATKLLFGMFLLLLLTLLAIQNWIDHVPRMTTHKIGFLGH